MAHLTYAIAKTQLKNQLRAFIELDDYANSNTPNLIGLGDTQRAAATGTYGQQVMAQWWGTIRSPISRLLSPGNVLGALVGALLDIAASIGLRSRTPVEIMAEWADYCRGFGGQAITGTTAANPVVVTSAAHGLTNGQWVRIDGVTTADELNGRNFAVANTTANTFELSGEDGSAYGAGTGGYWEQVNTFNSRDLTYGSIAAHGRNTGNGTISRCTVDEDGYDLENCHCEVKTWEIISDQNSEGEQHREVFFVEGEEAEPDFCQIIGSGLRTGVRCLTTRDSEAYIANPTFSSIACTAPTASTPTTLTAADDITNWTVTTYAAAQVQLDTTYRDLTGEGNTYAVTFTADNAITQVLLTQTRARLRADTPYYLQIAVYRVSSCDGTLTVAFGRTSKAFTVSSLNNAAWNICRMDLDKGLYLKNFTEDSLDITITLASRTTGSIHIDDIVFAPMVLVDGTWWAPVGGATPFRREDKFTATDTDPGSTDTLSYWLWRSGAGVNFPTATGGNETDADPA